MNNPYKFLALAYGITLIAVGLAGLAVLRL